MVPSLLTSLAVEAAHETAVLVDQQHSRMAGDPIAGDVLVVVVVDRREGPAVLVEESLRLVRRVVDVERDERVLGVFLDVLGEGDRLGIAVRSPGRVNLDEHGLTAEVGKRDLLSVDRRTGYWRCLGAGSLAGPGKVFTRAARGILVVLLWRPIALLAGSCRLGSRRILLLHCLLLRLSNDGLRVADCAAAGSDPKDEDQGEWQESPHRRRLDDRSALFVAAVAQS